MDDDDGAPRLELLAAMASSLKETDPEEGAAIDDLARKLAGREYFLDPRVFNHPQVIHLLFHCCGLNLQQ